MGAPDPMGTLLLLPQSTVEENSLFYRNTVNGKAEIPGCHPEAYFTPTAADQLCISPHPPPSSIPVRNPGSIPDTSPPSCPTFNPSPCPVYSTSLRELKTPLSTSITAALVQDSVVSQPHAHPAHFGHTHQVFACSHVTLGQPALLDNRGLCSFLERIDRMRTLRISSQQNNY